MTTSSLTRGDLNRATLARQLLLDRVHLSPMALLEHLVGLQAQEAQSWYTGFWSRLRHFDPEAVSGLLADRSIVRLALMRSTIHLVTALDARRLRPLLQTAVERPLTNRGARRLLKQRGYDDVLVEARHLLAERPMTNLELGRRLSERWPDAAPNDLAMAARVGLPLVQVPPRGLWRRTGAARHVPLESWLGGGILSDYSMDDLVKRYLTAFGPATVADAQAWSGLTRLRDVFDRLRPQLVAFRDEHGRELFDLPDAPRPPADTPAPARFLPTYDNLLLGHADRSRFLNHDLRNRLIPALGTYAYGALLVDGAVSGMWRFEGSPPDATLVVKLAEALSDDQIAEVTAEGHDLLRLWGREDGSVIFAGLGPV